MLPFDYNKGLYRRNNFGQPCVWYARPLDYNSIEVFHGIISKTITKDIIYINIFVMCIKIIWRYNKRGK